MEGKTDFTKVAAAVPEKDLGHPLICFFFFLLALSMSSPLEV
jgi:hypothetical protein